MAKLPDFLRVVEVEHQGETIRLEVQIQFTPEEIQRVLVPAVLKEITEQIRRSSGVARTSASETARGI